jgi:hypothetical protein
LKYVGFYEINREDVYQDFELDERLKAEYRKFKRVIVSRLYFQSTWMEEV